MAIDESLGTAFVDLRAGMSLLDRDLEQARTKVVSAMNRIGDQVGRLGSQMSLKLTLPIVAFGTGAARASMRFEQSFSRIRGLVGIAAEEVEEFRRQVLALAPAVGRGPQELAEALFFVTSAGARGAEAMDILEMSAKTAAAGLGETRDVALALVSAVNTWKSAGLTAAQATDIMVATVREGNLEASQLAGSLGMVFGSAQEAGASFADVGAAVAVMTRQGLNATRAITALNAVFGALLKPTPQAEEALAAVDLTLNDLTDTLREDGLLAMLELLKEAFRGNETEMTKVIPSIEALRAVFSILGQDAATVNGIFRNVADSAGVANGAFNIAAEDGIFKMNAGMAEMHGALIEIGDSVSAVVVPAFEKIIEVFKGASEAMSGWSDETKELVVVLLALVAALGPLLVGFAILIKSVAVIAGVLIPVVAAIGGVTVAVLALVAALGAVTWKALSDGKKEAEELIDFIDRNSPEGRRAAARERIMERMSPEDRAASEQFNRVIGDMDVDTYRRLVEEGMANPEGVDMRPLSNQLRAPSRGVPAIEEEEEEEIAVVRRTPEQIAKLREDTEKLTVSLRDLQRQNELLASGASESEAAFSDYMASLNIADENAEELAGTVSALREEFMRLQDASAARDIIRDIMTDQERLNEATETFADLREKGLLTMEQYERAVANTRKQLLGLRTDAEKTRDMAQQLGMTFSSSLEEAIVNFENLGNVMQGFLEDILRILVRISITTPIAEAISGAISARFGGGAEGSAKGNVFSGGRIIPFAAGGLVHRPTFFPMSDGNMGKAGEQGTEAIMPLTRLPGGDLGVRAEGGGGVVVNVIDQRSEGAKPEVSEGTGPDGRRTISIIVRDEMKSAMDTGKLDSSMKRNFGIRRQGGKT